MEHVYRTGLDPPKKAADRVRGSKETGHARMPSSWARRAAKSCALALERASGGVAEAVPSTCGHAFGMLSLLVISVR